MHTLPLATFARPTLLALALGAALLAPAGCTERQIENGPIYPAERAQARVLDVHVLRDETEISMTNSAGQDLPPGRLWINHWYAREFQGLKIGETVTYSLTDFKDRYGDAFRAGGFWATQKPDRVVQVQIESDSEIIGLIAIRSSRD